MQDFYGFLPSTLCFDPFIPIPILTHIHLALLPGFALMHHHSLEGVSIVGVPKSRMVYFMEHPIQDG